MSDFIGAEEAGAKPKAKKCEFHSSTVSFLGYIAAKGNLQMDPAMVCAITTWTVPENQKHLQLFLSFANFYRWLFGTTWLLHSS